MNVERLAFLRGRERMRELWQSLVGSPARQDLPQSVPDSYRGVWRRSLLQTPQGSDSGTLVYWLQTPRWHADLRLPADRPDFSGVSCLEDCDDAQLAWLATQQGFCGVTQVDGDICTWHRRMDFQPANGKRDIGRMAFDGERAVESGIEADYLEVWELLPQSRGASAALQLVVEEGELPARPVWLFVAGDCFILVRGRPRALPGAVDLASLIAGHRPTRAQCLEWLDVEISFGHRSGPTPWRIEHSTLPFCEGQYVTVPGAIQRRGQQIAIEGGNVRRWMILDWSADLTL